MAQLSRPYQIALAAMAVLGLVWVLALRGHGPSPAAEPSPSAPASHASAQSASHASTPSASHASTRSAGSLAAEEARKAAAPTRVYHGPAPGVEGLTRAIAKAHGAVAISQRNAAQLQSKSAAASGETKVAAAKASMPAATHTATHSAPHPAARHPVSAAKAEAPVSTAKGPVGRPAQQTQVEGELSHGKTVLLLFWAPQSSVDSAVRSEVLALGRGLKGSLAVHLARADQVGLFGPVTEVAHVYQTPTILIVNRHGLVSTLTGLTDVFSLKQAVREAQRAGR